jgi:hypothetical protein
MGFMGPSGPPGQGCETNCPSAGCGSGSLVFPASSRAFDRRRSGLRGIPGARAASPDRSRLSRKPSWTSLPSKALECGGTALAARPLVGFVRLYPLASRPIARPLPGAEAPIGSTGATRRIAFRPRGSSPPRRFPPRGGRGSVAPRSRTRVRRVSRTPAPDTRRPSEDGPECGTLTVALPATRFTPFEVFPSPTAAPRHRGRCHPCRYRPAEAGRRFDSMKLRSAEADPHVTEGSAGVGPPRTPCRPASRDESRRPESEG